MKISQRMTTIIVTIAMALGIFSGVGAAPQQAATYTLNLRVANGNNDVEERSDGSMSISSTNLQLVTDGSAQTVGIRFGSVRIPQGATITNAYLQFKTDAATSVSTNLTIRGEAKAQSPQFSTTARNVSSRTKTVSAVTWTPTAWSTVAQVGTAQQTPNLAPIVQEIVNQSAWVSGNAMSLIITGSGKRVAEAYEGDAAGAPLLFIEYSTDTLGSNLPTATAGATQIVNPTATVGVPATTSNLPLYLSLTSSQTLGGVAAADEDILRFDGASWSLFFDGSDVGVGSPDVFDFHIVDADTLLIAFSANVTVNGITFTPQDVARFEATALGTTTAGAFSMYFEGSDVGFEDTATAEKIDSISLLPDGRLLLSTTGNPVVPGVSTGRDEDVLAFTPGSLGNNTSGTWAMYFDASDAGMGETSGEDIDALDILNGNAYISSADLFSVNGVAGADEDVAVCALISTGDNTACTYSSALYFDGSTWGLDANDVDGFNVMTSGPAPIATNTAAPTATQVIGPTATLAPTQIIQPTATNTAAPTATAAPTQIVASPTLPSSTAVVAFPGAEGFGAQSVGGRGGTVIEVTNLNDSGSGSLRACATASGPRICVFRIGGTITTQSEIEVTNPYLTIAGQTAPGGGITLRAAQSYHGETMVISTHDVIIRYMRFRAGASAEPNSSRRSLTINGGSYNVILDHSSFSWATDQPLLLIDGVRDTTIQWSIISEGLANSTHYEAGFIDHTMGLSVSGKNYHSTERTGNITIHHNLLANNGGRNPQNAGYGLQDVVNNIIYNWRAMAFTTQDLQANVPSNVIGNYFKAGVNTTGYEVRATHNNDQMTGPQVYVFGNIGPHRTSDTQPQENVVNSASRIYLVPNRFPAPAVTTTSAFQAYEDVLAGAGVRFPFMDAVDRRVVEEVRRGEGQLIDCVSPTELLSPIDCSTRIAPTVNDYTKYGIMDPLDDKGWPILAAGTAPVDTDHDGMPDSWETARGLNPNMNDSALDRNGDGYTNIEEYINGLVP